MVLGIETGFCGSEISSWAFTFIVIKNKQRRSKIDRFFIVNIEKIDGYFISQKNNFSSNCQGNLPNNKQLAP
jgi:hypothetical protein